MDQDGADLVAVSVDPLPTAASTVKDESLTFPVASDPEAVAIRAWGVKHKGKTLAVPSVFIVDRDGIVRFRKIGETRRTGRSRRSSWPR